MTRRAAKETAKDTDVDCTNFGDDEADDSSSESCSLRSPGNYSGQKAGIDIALSMSCDTIDTDSSPWKPQKVNGFRFVFC